MRCPPVLLFACASMLGGPLGCGGDDGGGDTVAETTGTTNDETSTSTTGTDDTTSGETSGTTMVVVPCDEMEDCNSCLMCAIAEGGPCVDANQACLDNPACLALRECFSGCADDPCFETCRTNNPDGTADHDAAQDCTVCTTCPDLCPDFVPVVCEG